jgi:hypothetical protein
MIGFSKSGAQMTAVSKVSPLSDFQRDPAAHLKRLKETGEAEVLTVDGQAELIVQSAAAYLALLDQIDLSESTEILRAELAAADSGGPSFPAEEVLAEIREKLGLGANS